MLAPQVNSPEYCPPSLASLHDHRERQSGLYSSEWGVAEYRDIATQGNASSIPLVITLQGISPFPDAGC